MSKSRARFLAELLGTDGLVKKAKSALAGADEVIDLSALPSIPNSKLTNSSITINSSATSLGGSVTLTTANVAENTNLYYTDARADARIAAADTGDLSEGSNLYYTDARADARVNLQTGSNLNLSSKNTGDLSEGSNLYYTNARADARIAAASTSDLSEGTNLYYTDARADARVALIVDSAPGTLNTLNELAAALGDDANFSTTVTNSIAAKLPLAGGAMTGAITTNSTFDGRDVATDGTKLDGIEVGADVTDTANVTSSGALMDSEVTNLAQVKAFDSSDYATAAQGTTANAALPKAGGTMTGTLAMGANAITSTGTISSGAITSSAHTIYTQASTLEGINLVANVNSANQNSDSPKIQFNGEYQTNGPYIYGDNIGSYGYKSLKFYTNRNSATDYTTAPTVTLTLDSAGNAQFTGTISSGAITSTGLVLNGGRTAEGVTAAGTYAELTRASGGDLGLLFNKDTSKWLIGIDNSDGNAANLRFMYGAYNASVHPGFGSDYSGLNLTYQGRVGVGTRYPGAELEVAGTALVENAKLKAIAESNTDTAVDVFVYDTRKDSDGGAWRKRTQNTSWYNEALNTSTRGARKEFPSVAVIVALPTAGNNVTIYDGDDPDLPMWMKFTLLNQDQVSIAAINGLICLGNKWAANAGYGGNGLVLFDFVADRSRHAMSNGTVPSYDPERLGVISGNQASTSIWPKNSANAARFYTLVDYSINDVAMTVLPNAPIDADTGLPVPTIAVGTNTGLSIIKDDGTVINRSTSFVNSTSPGGVHDISFDNNNGYWYTNCHYPPNSSATSHAAVLGHSPSISTTGALASSDTQNYSELMMAIGSNDAGNTTHWSTTTMPGLWMNSNQYPPEANAGYMEITPHGDFANRYGLHKFLPNYADHSASAVAYVASDYNTGYMVGRTKLATLSDTSTTNAASTDLLGGIGNFTDANAWTVPSGWSLSSNIATGSAVTAYLLPASNGILTAGKQYVVTVTQSGYTSGALYLYMGTGAPNGYYYASIPSTAGTFTYILTAYNSDFGIYGANYTGVIDNVTISLAEEDRSMRGNGVQVFGTVTKTAVATGAELVAYSGFSSSNGLVLPYSSSIEPGTGDYSVIVWMKCSATTSEQTIARRFGTPTVTGGFLVRLVSSTSTLQWYTRDTSSNVAQITTTQALDDGSWKQIIGTREGGRMKLYINGVLQGDIATSASSHNAGTTAPLNIGVEGSGSFVNPATATSLALFRYSLSAPSSEQVTKMYNDEKHLFQENAKATLYGSSDAVTALAYDDDTELLHVGTSAGRSVFQGLNRVDNTTDAVGAAISASNGFIVEE